MIRQHADTIVALILTLAGGIILCLPVAIYLNRF